ncbi:MAG: XRE family transcriptional regulator [Rhizobiaceae bacterium]|nr:XRE family transcriptional regulator [Rhizobiaceae bacterium]
MENIRPLRTEEDYDWALAEIGRYFDNPPEVGSHEADRFDVLSTLAEAYENAQYPIQDLAPVPAILAFMEMTGRTQADLAALLGSRSRASEILNYRRPLTMDAAHRLSRQWRIPADILIKPYRLESSRERRTS